MLVEELNDHALEEIPDITAERANLYDFYRIEPALIEAQRRMDRLSPSENSRWVSEEDFRNWFQTLHQTVHLKERSLTAADPSSPELEKITPERLGHDIAVLGGLYKNFLTHGTLTAYNLPAQEYDLADLQAIEDPEERQRKQAQFNQLSKYDADLRTGYDRVEQARKVKSPELIERLPISLSNAMLAELLVADEQVRQEAVAELLDPHRRRHDKDAGLSDEIDQEIENYQIGELIKSLEPSWQRDLLAADAWRFFVHANIDNPQMAEQVLGLMSPELEDIIQTLHEKLLDADAKDIVKSFTAQSQRSLERVRAWAEKNGTDTSGLMEAAHNIRPQLRLSINVKDRLGKNSSFDVILKFLLEDHHLLSAHEVGSNAGTMSIWERLFREAEFGLDPHNLKLDRPISGSLNYRPEEVLHGDSGARHYGSSTIVLKPEVARDRGLYFWGDSARASNHQLEDGALEQDIMTFDDAAKVKVLHDRTRQVHPRLEYMEGIIVGGVTPDDVESITLPFREIVHVSRGLRTVADRYPSIQFNCTLSAEEAAQNADYLAAVKTAKLGNVHIIIEE